MAATLATVSPANFLSFKPHPASSTADPFWPLPPRSRVDDMSRTRPTDVPRAGDVSDLMATSTPRNKPPPARRPQCTHMTITRLYGPTPCQICHSPPSLGWLYVCQQDIDFAQTRSPSQPPLAVVFPDESGGGAFDSQARVADSLGMSPSVTRGIRGGAYSLEEVKTLIEQKLHLLSTIRRAEGGGDGTPPKSDLKRSQAETALASLGPSSIAFTQLRLPMSTAGTPENTPSASRPSTPRSSPKIASRQSQRQQPCNLQVCHPCRPFLRDRVYISFEAILSGTLPALTESEISRLPLIHPEVFHNKMRNAETPPPPTSAGPDEEDDDFASSSTWTSSSDSDATVDPYPCPGPGSCGVFSRYSGCAYEKTGFDDGLRALNHGFGPGPETQVGMTTTTTMTTPDHSIGDQQETPEGALSSSSYYSTTLSGFDDDGFKGFRSAAPEMATPHVTAMVTPERSVRNHEGTPGWCESSSSASSSSSLPAPLTPLKTGMEEEMFFDEAWNLHLALSSVGGKKARSFCVGEPPGRQCLKEKLLVPRKASLGSEVEVRGGVALTEESVGLGLPDIARGV